MKSVILEVATVGSMKAPVKQGSHVGQIMAMSITDLFKVSQMYPGLFS